MIFLKITRDGTDLEDVQSEAEIVTIGADPGNIVVLESTNIGGRHAQIDARTLLLTAMDTPAGVVVNGERLADAKPLDNGDEFAMGPYQFRFFHSGHAFGGVADTRTWKVPAGTMTGAGAGAVPAGSAKTVKI